MTKLKPQISKWFIIRPIWGEIKRRISIWFCGWMWALLGQCFYSILQVKCIFIQNIRTFKWNLITFAVLTRTSPTDSQKWIHSLNESRAVVSLFNPSQNSYIFSRIFSHFPSELYFVTEKFNIPEWIHFYTNFQTITPYLNVSGNLWYFLNTVLVNSNVVSYSITNP